jgi:predicted ATPase
MDRIPADLKYAFFLSYVREDVDQVLELKTAITAVAGRGGSGSRSIFSYPRLDG